VVEDDAIAARALATLIERAGYAVRVAADGAAALAEAPRFVPDIVFLDLRLPDIDGHEVAKRLRGMHWERRPLLVGISGYSEELDRLRASDDGVDLSYRKPADPEALLRLLSRWADSPPRP
jgi:CheY-like chemotaxis protein